MLPEPKVYAANELHIGLTATFERTVSEADIMAFATNSGDCNPLHIDRAYAQSTAYGERIVHGAFQVGLASALIGMHLPGRNVLLAGINARFPAPLYYPGRVLVRGEITAWNAASRTGQLTVTVVDSVRQVPTADITMGFTLHEPSRAGPALSPPPTRAVARQRKVVLVTGAAGGLGAHLVRALVPDFDVLAAIHRQPLGDDLRALAGVQECSLDLSSSTWDRTVLDQLLGEGSLYGIVHAAWPGLPLGGLLQAQPEVLENQLLFGASSTIRLARLLFDKVGPEGGRIVAISSVAGTMKPALTMSAYSLGKAAQESTVRLLAPELARRQVTINAVCPAFIPTGMNKHKSEQQCKIEASRVPLGRLCGPEDVAGMVRYLLSPAAGFVSGQVLGLTGGQL